MPFLVAYFEPEVLGQATRDLVSGDCPELQFVSLLPGEVMMPLLRAAEPSVRERVLLDASPELIGSGEVRAVLTTDVQAAAAALPEISPSDIVTWPSARELYRRWSDARPQIRFYGQFDPPVDKILYDTYFSGVRDGFFIEAGASDGVEENCCKAFEEFLGWRGMNVEPSPANFELLQAARPDAINVRAALSDRDGTATFTNALHPERGARFGNGSLSHTEAHVQELVETGCTFEAFDVETVRYDTLLRRHRIDRVDLFVLDVEGHELSALRGMEGTEVWPQVLCVEFGNIGLDGLRSRLEPLGYRFDFTAFNNAYFCRPV
jgi:FkbM family methyltransferase